jgi:hypothetical protein
VGRNSAWQQAVVSGHFDIDDSDPNNPIVQINDATKFTRQYFKFVRAGAARVEATSNNANLDPLAFINTDGKYVVVVKASGGESFSVQGLPAGTYGIKYTTPSEYDVDLAEQTIGSGEALATAIPESGVLTIHGISAAELPVAGVLGLAVAVAGYATAGALMLTAKRPRRRVAHHGELDHDMKPQGSVTT